MDSSQGVQWTRFFCSAAVSSLLLFNLPEKRAIALSTDSFLSTVLSLSDPILKPLKDSVDSILIEPQPSPDLHLIPPQYQGSIFYQAHLTDEKKVIALTFDDGPWKDTPDILAVLQQHQVKATFFLLGENLSQYPETVQQIVDADHAVGNHTWTHPADFINPIIAAEEIEKTTAKIEQLTGVKTQLFRPPYGYLNNGVADSAKDRHYVVVMWSIDSQDYRQLSATSLTNQMMAQVHPGGIILLHDGGGNRQETVKALAMMIPRLKQQGYQFVTIPELLRLEARQTQNPEE